jgi:putative transposase
MYIKSYKIRLDFNNVENTLAKKHAGVARHAYNWGLSVCKKAYENKEKRPTGIDLHKKLVAEVKKEHNWYYEVSKCSPQQALRDLDMAYKRFFKKKAKHPIYKKKGQKDSFYLEGNIKLTRNKIKLPIFGEVNLSEKLNIEEGKTIKLKNVTISREADFWFVSFKTEEIPRKKTNIPVVKQGDVGVDLGIKILATLSSGVIFENKRPYKKFQRKLKIAQRKLSKKYQKGKSSKEQSKNYQKQKAKVALLHYKISCIRKDSIHKLTNYLVKNHDKIVIEDLNIKGMSKNHKLASAILDGGFYEFRRQLTYKCEWYGAKLVIADRFFASSKTCSNCRNKKEKLHLSEREYHCEKCNLIIDRDLNASLNLKGQAVS